MSDFLDIIAELWTKPRWHLLWCWPISIALTIMALIIGSTFGLLDWLYEARR